MTTYNTKELDEIMDKIYDLAYDHLPERGIAIGTDRIKQAILDWHNKQIEQSEEVLTTVSLEDAIKALGHSFRDLSYHSDGRWIARSGANTGRFITSAREPKLAVFKLARKIQAEKRQREAERNKLKEQTNDQL